MKLRIFSGDATDAGISLVITLVILVGGFVMLGSPDRFDRVTGWVMVGGALLSLPFGVMALRGIAKRRRQR